MEIVRHRGGTGLVPALWKWGVAGRAVLAQEAVCSLCPLMVPALKEREGGVPRAR